ncbi:unnamed protein product [Acanthoscelides obtectus]|uniref:Protein Jumonji n=1 Tax=Acanthoscelides obtectus TaxID=200917 RepID=A0A9P0KA19_ACAOB|nr:unnamed protein product [Acanthoscelides obtectus]CAK1645435.1 Protein Jumonji [Acanthoscelides obtectus]
MKRKRKNQCPSPLLDDSPKRTKVHAQRKFAQGSNVNSPVITPIKELESEIPHIDVMPEPVELLPMKRQDTEDFLTFLCFRGTPVLPPGLNFFNTASIVDTNGQVHEIKSEGPKNGPIDIAKCSTSEKPFIAFGVRKRADPIIISKQMDRKRRHALALQALRRKYQEQKMAKIRALTISKLSEKFTNRTVVKTNTVSKTETITKKTNSFQKTKVMATKHVKVTTQTLKTTLRPKLKHSLKQNMCLRSFRGRFVHKELPFRKTVHSDVRTGVKRPLNRLVVKSNKRVPDHNVKVSTSTKSISNPKVVKKTTGQNSSEKPEVISPCVKRSDMSARRKQLKKRMLMANPTTLVKTRSLRLTTVNKTILSQRKDTSVKHLNPKLVKNDKASTSTKTKPSPVGNEKKPVPNEENKMENKIVTRRSSIEPRKKTRQSLRRLVSHRIEVRREMSKTANINKVLERKKRLMNRNLNIKKQAKTIENKKIIKTPDTKKDVSKTADVKKEETKFVDIKKEDKSVDVKKEAGKLADVKKEVTRTSKRDISKVFDIKKETNISGSAKKGISKTVDIKTNVTKKVNIKKVFNKSSDMKKDGSKIVNIKKEMSDVKKEGSKLPVPKKAVNKPSDKKDTVKPVVATSEMKKGVSQTAGSETEVNKSNETKTDISKANEVKREVNTRSSEAKKEANKIPDVKKEETKPVDGKKGLIKGTEAKQKMQAKKVVDKKKEDSELEDSNKAIIKSSELKKEGVKSPEIKKDAAKPSSSKTGIASVTDKETKGPTVAKNEAKELPSQTVKGGKNTDKKSEDTPKIKDTIPAVDTKEEKSELKKEMDIEEFKERPKSPAKITVAKRKVKREDSPKLTRRSARDEKSPVANARPTRKTKEAAAIYMEILSHKLDSKVDDDNVSIDSFPELPNVKKTEQRENELKAKAKSSKDDIKSKESGDESKGKRTRSFKDWAQDEEEELVAAIRRQTTETKPGSEVIQSPKDAGDSQTKEIDDKDRKQPVEKKIPQSNDESNLSSDKVKINENTEKKRIEKNSTVSEETKSVDKNKKSTDEEMDKNQGTGKKPNSTKTSNPNTGIEAEFDKNEVTKDTKEVEDSGRRHTRNSTVSQINQHSDDSDESFHVSIKVPRKRKMTRSKGPVKPSESENPKSKASEPLTKLQEPAKKPPTDLSDSDQSTTSDMNLKVIMNKVKNKKFSKTKSMTKTEKCFIDSDEEPLSKLTNKSGDDRSETVKASDSKASTSKKEKIEAQKEVPAVKPKRECAKRPQNYLPMLSSSDEDEIFHGFDEKTKQKVPNKPLEVTLAHVPPLLELFSKDLDRRFGKEKVNMSNAQIEKWLNDSALAGNSIKKENDEMLKFGERIPTETSFDSTDAADIEKLKHNILSTPTKSAEATKLDVCKVVDDSTKSEVEKTPKQNSLDRKPIFRKSRTEITPNVNAFSPENESSVYAFGEDNEEVVSTPFRRPSRRPSSTATSKSEDESSKQDELKKGQFRRPLLKQEHTKSKEELESSADADDASYHFYIPQKPCKSFSKAQTGAMKSKVIENRPLNRVVKGTDRLSAERDDFKYKVPSSPSASSSSSAKIYKRQTPKQKIKSQDVVSPVYVSEFPKRTDPAKLVEAPVFHPTDQEFQDPLEYLERIRHKAEPFGICKIVPPSSFKPECKVSDDMRFTSYNQYVHKMLHRWGPNFKELMAIKKYLETQNIGFTHSPWIGGMEIDLPRLYQTVQNLGGLKEVIEKKKWPRVSELMKIPKSAQDRVTKLDDIYCKYLLPYDTLSPAERQKLFDEVEAEWARRQNKSQKSVPEKTGEGGSVPDGDDSEQEFNDNEAEECITKGRNMALNAFYRIARNTMSMHFKNAEPSAQEVEQEYWKYVTLRQNHICVHSGSIDSGSWGYGFAVSKNSPFARHAWNLKVLTNNCGSVLRSLGPVMGVTVPTLHVGMVFSACCWYRDPHGLPWIEYLHTGGSKIWYGIPNTTSDQFRAALQKLVPNCCRDKELWLPSDTVMIPPSLLIENGVSLCRAVQEPGQFVVVFPKVFTSSISTGYVVSESVYFAPPYWLKSARNLFDVLRNSCEPSMFSLDRLLINIANDTRSSIDILRQVLPHVQDLCNKETEKRTKLKTFGDLERESMPLPDPNNRKKKKMRGEEGDYECEICRVNLFTSMVRSFDFFILSLLEQEFCIICCLHR